MKVTDINEFNQGVKQLNPGDSIVLANGVWKNVEFKFKGTGEKDNCIYMMAETPGKVFIEGKSRLQFSGKYLHVSGFVFRNGSTPKTAVIEFRTSSEDYAYHSVLSNCVIDHYTLTKDEKDAWVNVYGKENTVEYCYFAGKANDGVTLIIWPNDSNSIDNNHLIRRNYFGHRPRLGSNGGESIRIGTSHVCHLNSGSIVEGNYFERCNGEVEIISNKSGGNKFLNNTFYECEGSLVLRHGDNGIVAGNWFIGNDKPFTGGVRIVNEGHQVYNNFFYKLTGTEFRAPLSIMNGIPNSPANGYNGVKNVIVSNNTFVECTTPWELGVGFGSRDRTVAPENTMILNNIVYSPKEQDLIKIHGKVDGVGFDNNLLVSKAGMLEGEGLVTGELFKGEIWGVNFVGSNAKSKKLGFIRTDILGATRGNHTIGAFQVDTHPHIEMATADNCGPIWYKPEKEVVVSKVHLVQPTDNLQKIVTSAKEGDIIELASGTHLLTNKVVISKSLTFRSAKAAKEQPIITMEAKREHAYLFEIEGNSTVKFENLAIHGNNKAQYPVKYAIVTSKTDATNYNLMIDNCTIYDFTESTGGVFSAYKGTIADTIRVTNSEIKNCNRGFILSQEKEEKGKYSAEFVILENTSFSNITQYVIDYYRGGLDESTLGGFLDINHCVFDLSPQEEKHYIIKNNGIVHVTIKNSIFSRSKAKIPLRLNDAKHQIVNCNFFECADPKLSKTVKSENLYYVNPRFAKKSYHLDGKSKLIDQADDGSNIGLK